MMARACRNLVVRMREAIVQHHDLARRLDALEQKYDGQFGEVFAAIRERV